MNSTLDMTKIRQLNLFEKLTGISTKSCFIYNNAIIFAVFPEFISRAIGESGRNVKRISAILGKKIKVVGIPRNSMEIKNFIANIISPLEVKEVEITEKELIITAYKQNKASLIGRNKTRLEELELIVKEQLGKELRII